MKFSAYTDYKDSGLSWVGEVPTQWSAKPLFTVFEAPLVKNLSGSVTNVLSLSYGCIVKRNVEKNHGLLPESFNTYQIVQPNDIIMRLTDLQNDKKSLRTGLVTQNGIITSAYLRLKSGKQLAPRYAHYLLHAYDKSAVYYGMGGGLRQSMKFDDLRRLEILLPSCTEQKTIAAFLDYETAKIDQLIAKQKRLIALLKEKRQAVISHAVTKGLNPNAPMKDSGVEWLGEVPEHWEVRRIKHLAKIQSGKPKGSTTTDKAISVPMLRVANVQDGYVDIENVHQLKIEPNELHRYSLRSGDVLMNEGGDNDKLGRGALWLSEIEPCIHQNHVFAVRCHDLEGEWLTLVTSTSYAKFHFFSLAKQSTNLASISSSNVKETPIVVPPPQERLEIRNHLKRLSKKLNKLLGAATSQIDLLKERRSALISAAVTGKIDVRDWKQPNL